MLSRKRKWAKEWERAKREVEEGAETNVEIGHRLVGYGEGIGCVNSPGCLLLVGEGVAAV